MTHGCLSSAGVQVICADDEDRADTRTSTNGSRPAMLASSTFGAASDMPARAMVCGTGHGLGGVRGQGGIQVVKGNTCKMDVIDARGMIHFANPDVVSFVL